MSGPDALLERGRELDTLAGLVQAARAGGGALALVEGPAGIGKSRLLAAVREQAAAAGFRVLAARGSDLERELPFGVVRQLFEPQLADPDQRARWLAGSARSAADVFAPPADGAAAGDVAFGLLYGLYWLTANLAADAPLLLALDDLHWCDTASLRFVAYLERRLEGLPVLVAAAARTGEPGAAARLLDEIAGDPGAVAVRPRALSEAAVAELVRARLGATAEPPFCAACRRATGGNPLLLRELLKTLEAEGVPPDAAHAAAIREVGPRAVSRTVLLRLARLPPDAVAVARAVAILGEGAALPATAALAELDEERVAAGARVLVDAEILQAGPVLAFVHPLVREAVEHGLAAAERVLLHRRAARALVELGAAAEAVAAHLLLVPGGGEPWAAALLREAGLAAGRRGAADSAVAYLRRALEEPPPAELRPQLLLELGLVEGMVNVPTAVEHLREAHAQLDDPEERALAADALARSLIFTHPPQEAVAVVRRAVAELPADRLDQRRAFEAFELYAEAFGARVPDAAARLAAVRAAGLPDGLGGRMLAAVAAWDWALRDGSADACSRCALAALADGQLIAADPGFMTIVANAVLVLADRDEALDVWDEAMRAGHRLGSLYAVCGVNLWRGWTWLQRGELAEAEDALRQAREQTMLVEEHDGAGWAYVSAFLARVLLERGDPAGARAALADGGQPAPGSDGDGLMRRSTVELLLAEERWEAALAAADVYRGRLRDVENAAWAPWRSLKAEALAALGRRGEAVALLEDELAAARRWGAPGALGRSLRLLGGLRPRLELLEEAVAVTGGPATRLEHAKALTALGCALAEARPADARAPLRHAFELASRCGAQPLAARARTALYAAGGRPRREALTGPESLTPSERRVAELAARGESNRDIAQALFVTPKTVELHLTSVYRKLGIPGRRGLAGALAA